jgi:hypothetical protein
VKWEWQDRPDHKALPGLTAVVHKALLDLLDRKAQRGRKDCRACKVHKALLDQRVSLGSPVSMAILEKLHRVTIIIHTTGAGNERRDD